MTQNDQTSRGIDAVDTPVVMEEDAWDDAELLDEVADKYLKQQSGMNRKLARSKLAFKRRIWKLMLASTHFLKRLLDIFGALMAILCLSPVFIFTWVAIRIEDPGPAFFKQERVGRWGQTFTMYKFRSMVMNADKLKDQLLEQNESGAGVIFKMKQDPRITKVGKWIRKLSIDELPQLYNVLIGDMSLVGPRPPVPREVAEYSLADRRRLDVIPGITDVEYIRSQSFLNDILILLKTIPAVLLGKGAY
jgi:lipopolysaccharide/colanic/teichoic acid biosynthesis glycosyltransferase